MRSLALLVVISLAACFGKADALMAGGDDGKQAAAVCGSDLDCVAVAPTCCECATYATSREDPLFLACADVDCPPPEGTCEPATAVCSIDGLCELRRCQPMQCPSDCPVGYATDANGCLTCQCAGAPANGCMVDGDCVQTRADCCGCALGGKDTAVLKQDQPAYDAALMCPAAPTCPGINVCDASLAPHCVSGSCVLTAGSPLPPNACGRPDLPPCPEGTQCTVNASDPANMQGVGTCEPKPRAAQTCGGFDAL